jgi:lactoylglutathione lyase
LRVVNAAASIAFYSRHFGFTAGPVVEDDHHVDAYACIPKGEGVASLLGYSGVWLKFRQVKGAPADVKYDSGNNEPRRGFGHVAVLHNDVYAACEVLEKAGVSFKKKPDEGRMKGLAFALDPDGYWIEIIKRTENSAFNQVPGGYNFAQTMIRIKDPKRSLPFYTQVLGMTMLQEKHFGPESGDFSLYFLASPQHLHAPAPADPTAFEETKPYLNSLWQPVIELTWNHGTESKDDFRYYNGNEEPFGFSHLGFLSKDLSSVISKVPNVTRLSDKRVIITDPDNYHVLVELDE